ncbi:low molecular weight phosphotyrosine protein phosphatase [Phototrophicus methaneseepsis]|uniref:protein-tyrosine-phosphatase n=1 Tax=Phototrophicus methaneseepsis TaxID=2710758 RepID=A0A7S8EDN9_9CHLR|nr:low molecular weight protein-tyrosine-phosphatase [Phototrophicus methaneseepsis]QPC85041.1 low molecular weight phosphotyrosine protein phosphatase [Phototrophicus methaneseepsis]
MIRVLFVCLGNICRSPMAEAVFQHSVNQAGLGDQFEIDSAGTGGWHAGEQAHSGTRNVLKVNNIPYDGRARQIVRDELAQYDYVLVMDRSNLSDIMRFGEPENTEIALFLSYAVQDGLVDVDEVPDPYYTNNFDYVYDLVQKGSQALLEHIQQQHNI